eukprot:5532456-Ditylum_brightwellii.AAC.1
MIGQRLGDFTYVSYVGTSKSTFQLRFKSRYENKKERIDATIHLIARCFRPGPFVDHLARCFRPGHFVDRMVVN